MNRERVAGSLVHILGLLTWILGPLFVYLLSDSAFVRANARRAFNWQAHVGLYLLLSAALILVLIGIVMLPLVAACDVLLCLVAAVRASDGEVWSYPLSVDLL